MRIKDLKPEQIRRYFEGRLQGQRFTPAAGGYLTFCCFHENKNSPALSVSFEKAVWFCHSNHGCGHGGIIDFEMKFTGCDHNQAIANIASLTGCEQLTLSAAAANEPEMTFDYRDEMGRLVFQVLRYKNQETGKKRIVQRRPCQECHNGKDPHCPNADCRHGWIWKKEGTRKLLYRLPEVITATDVYVVEGEKKVEMALERMVQLQVPEHIRVAWTTSPEGAGKWLGEFSPFLTGKRVTIFEDNDEPGQKHAQVVAESVSRYAAAVKVVSLPGLAEKEGIDDWFEKHNKTLKETIQIAAKTHPWHRPESGGTAMFVDVETFIGRAPIQKDWVVKGLIERGSGGFIISKPKGGKSFSVTDMAISLASGQPWLDFEVEQCLRVAHFAREDNADMTSWRYNQLCKRRGIHPADIRDMIYLNTRRETPRFMLDDEEWVLQAIRDMKALGTQFFIIDVLNKCHGADENDNTEMRQIMDRVDQMANETGAQFCIVHHYSKSKVIDEDVALTEMMRGASAIAGAAEWLAGFFLVDEEKQIRKAKFDSKSALPPQPFYWKINSGGEEVGEGIRLERVPDYEPPKKRRRQQADPEEEMV